MGGFYDSDGVEFNCMWYAEMEDGATRCTLYGGNYANAGLTANLACCVCGGGTDDGWLASCPLGPRGAFARPPPTPPGTTAERWTEELITKLLEVTHGQWLYRNIQVHDKVAGTLATLRKEEIQMEIEEQQALWSDGLLDEDCHLGECNLGDLKHLGNQRNLLAIGDQGRSGGRQVGGTTDTDK